jgi:hypothetical protein
MATLVRTRPESKPEEDVQDEIESGIPEPFPLTLVLSREDNVKTVPGTSEVTEEGRVPETSLENKNGLELLEVRAHLIFSF